MGSYYFQIRGKSTSNSKNLQGEVWRLLGLGAVNYSIKTVLSNHSEVTLSKFNIIKAVTLMFVIYQVFIYMYIIINKIVN